MKKKISHHWIIASTKVISIIALLSSAASTAQMTFPFFYGYVVANYTCKGPSTTTHIKVYSQVFAACYADGQTLSSIAQSGNDLSIAEQIAKQECQRGNLGVVSLRIGSAHSGPNAREKSEQERTENIKEFVSHGGRAAVFNVAEAVYSKSCK